LSSGRNEEEKLGRLCITRNLGAGPILTIPGQEGHIRGRGAESKIITWETGDMKPARNEGKEDDLMNIISEKKTRLKTV